VAVAGATAMISGVSVFVNGYGVHSFSSAAVYTTAKNLVAAVVLAIAAAVGLAVRARRRGGAPANFVTAAGPGDPGRPDDAAAPTGWRQWGPLQWLGLAYVGVVGGGLAFVAFFDGYDQLAKTDAAPAAFWRDTLVVWVAVLAVAFLRERLRWWNLAAIALLVVGEVVVTRGVGHLGSNRAELLVLGSSVLWAVEVVVAKVLLRAVAPGAISVIRMGVGAVTLLVYLAGTGALGGLRVLDAGQLRWALWTGLLLAAYVGTWFTALARARAVDVTSILVASALMTWLLQLAAGTATRSVWSLGLVLVAAGAALVGWASRHRPAEGPGALGR
jgi:drug/metabolite transporter (DMT)-like permease